MYPTLDEREKIYSISDKRGMIYFTLDEREMIYLLQIKDRK